MGKDCKIDIVADGVSSSHKSWFDTASSLWEVVIGSMWANHGEIRALMGTLLLSIIDSVACKRILTL